MIKSNFSKPNQSKRRKGRRRHKGNGEGGLHVGLKGRYTLFPNSPKQEIVENNIVWQGRQSFLQMLVQAISTDVGVGGNYYVGLCGYSVTADMSLANLVGEPTIGTNGYQRIAIPRNPTGWPTVDRVNGISRAVSRTSTFAASGGAIGPFRRLFLTNASSGSSGVLYSISGPFDADRSISAGETLPIDFELYLR